MNFGKPWVLPRFFFSNGRFPCILEQKTNEVEDYADFDTHAHYDADRFDSDRDALLSAMPGVGVGLVLDPGCDLPSSRAAAELAEPGTRMCTPPWASIRRTATAFRTAT